MDLEICNTTQSVDSPYDEDNRHNAENSEPVRLIPGRRDAEVQSGTGFVPDAIVITSDHAKTIVSRRQVCVGNLPSAYGAVPVIIVALELVAELDVFWGRQAESRVFKLQIPGSWPRLNLLRSIGRLDAALCEAGQC